MKKNLVATALISIAIVLALSAGTYAYFTARVTSTGNTFTTGKLELNNNTLDVNGPLFTAANCKPGDSHITITPFTITNTGTLDLKVKATVSESYTKGADQSVWAGDSHETVNENKRKHFQIQPTVTLNGDTIVNEKNGKPMSFDEFDSWLEELLNDKELKAHKDAEGSNPVVNAGACEINGIVWLDSAADNCYQDVKASIDIAIDATQIDGEYATQ